mgnify:FL=1
MTLRTDLRTEAQQLRVLVVERDARAARAVIRAVAAAEPEWMVQSARSAGDAARLVGRRPWDALLVAEPVWDEHEELRKAVEAFPDLAVVLIREEDDAATSPLPVIARSALGTPEAAGAVEAAVRQQRRLRHRSTMLRWLEREARTDPVTGLANRPAFREEFAELCAESRRRGLPAALILFEVVGLRVVNDVHGREAGERLLHRIGRIVAASVRTGDLAARVDAGRFAVALGGADLVLARRIARRVAHEIERSGQHAGEIPAAVSIAVAAGKDPDPAELWARALEELRQPRAVPLPLAAYAASGDDGPSVA